MTLDIDIRKRMAEDKKYLCGDDFADGKDRIVQIKDVMEEIVENPRNGAKSKEIVLHFEGDVKPMVLSAKVNMKNVAKATGTSRTVDWPGKKLQLFGEYGCYFGENGFAVRIRDFAPHG